MFKVEDFNFSHDEMDLVFSIKYFVLKKTISEYRQGFFAAMVSSKDQTARREEETKGLMNLWLEEWHEKTVHLLNIKNKIEFDSLKNEIKQRNFSSGKLSALITESTTFFPFYPLEEKDKRFDKLEIDVETYLKNLSLIFPKKYTILEKSRDIYQDAVNKIAREVNKKINILLWTSIAALIALILAPHLADGLENFLGLHGAAAISAGLAH